MSEITQTQQEEQEQNSIQGKNSKQKNIRKLSEGFGISAYCEPNTTTVGAITTTKTTVNKIPLQTSTKYLQMSQKSTTSSIASRKDAGSNWEAVAKAMQPAEKKMDDERENFGANGPEKSVVASTKSARNRQKRRAAEEKYVAVDCEMVGVGINGQDDMLARVSIVSKMGAVLLDKFVKPQETVTDYRTKFSGIRPNDINNGEDFHSVQEEVVQMLQGKILIGHAIKNDLAVLHIKHPQSCIRDTSRYKPLCRLVSNGRTPSLKRLSQAILGKEIQTGEHNSIEDARAAMSIYNFLAKDWEAYIRKHHLNAGK